MQDDYLKKELLKDYKERPIPTPTSILDALGVPKQGKPEEKKEEKKDVKK